MARQTTIEASPKKLNLKYERDKKREKVQGIFRFYEVPGGRLAFCYREFKEDDVENFEFVDGQIYTIPLGVAQHLNKNGAYPVYEYTMGSDGKPVHSGYADNVMGTSKNMRVGKKVRRFGFESLEFHPHDNLMETPSPIVTVENI